MTEFKPHPTETIPEGEMAAIQTVVEKQMAIIRGAMDPHKRGQHPKTTALLQATFAVEKDLPDVLKVGLFKSGKTFDALIRLSTGLVPMDNEPNTHAMGIKVLDVAEPASTGELKTQDFISLVFPHFFIQTVAQYAEMFTETMTDRQAPNFWGKHPALAYLTKAHFKIINFHLEQQFWGQTPIAFGDRACRFTIAPHAANLSGLPQDSTADGLRTALVDQLTTKRRTMHYDFCIQLQTDPATMPVEDATVPWASPFFKVANISIPAQDFMSDDQFNLGENIAYDPWHCLAEHRPLGGVQRCRKLVYEASRNSRHKENSIPNFTLTRDKLKVLGAVHNKAAA